MTFDELIEKLRKWVENEDNEDSVKAEDCSWEINDTDGDRCGNIASRWGTISCNYHSENLQEKNRKENIIKERLAQMEIEIRKRVYADE